MIASFTLQEKEILCKATGAGGGRGHKAHPPVLKCNKNYPFLLFCVFLIQAFLNSNMHKMLHKSAEIDVLELLNLQNVLRPEPLLG